MNKRVEILKRVVSFLKKRKVPKKIIIILIFVILLFLYSILFLTVLWRYILKVVFPSRKVLITYYLLIVIITGTMCIIVGTDNLNKQANVLTEVNQPVDMSINDNEKEKENNIYVEKENVQSDISTETSNEQIQELNQIDSSTLKDMSFYIKVNRIQNCITIYTQDESGLYTIPVKAMRCSTGGENTPLGIFRTSQKYPFRKLLFNVYGQYATRITGQILFHSSSYEGYTKDSLIAEEYNKLGEAASHGCIRLTVEDAKWIYDYCKVGTMVEIYDDNELSGPLGKPDVIHIPEDSKWDPTDPDENNPWTYMLPTISGAKNQYVTQGYQPDLRKDVSAVDSCGNDITNQIKISGEVNGFVLGRYSVTYSVTDLLGRTNQTTVYYTVR